MGYESVIGLEVHCRLLTDTKLFCGCSTAFGRRPNSQTCPVCLGMPGALPAVNGRAIELALKTACALHCTVRSRSTFARKNYFYPDLPKGYQISQFELPIAECGYVEMRCSGKSGAPKVGVTRIHLEEDAGKLMHDPCGSLSDSSLIDCNRAGIPLIEIVGRPELHSPREAGEYLRTLRAIVQYLDVCDGNMEQGGFRCDANISLRPAGMPAMGTRVELKNLNSFRHVEKALEHEIERQTGVLESGKAVVQQTRLWDETAGETRAMRGKEEEQDYRYFDEPDLAPVVADDTWIQDLRRTLPELPLARRDRFMRCYGLPEYDAAILVSTRSLADYFEMSVSVHNNPKAISNWIMGDVLRHVADPGDCDGFAVTPRHLAKLIELIDKGDISGTIARNVFEDMCTSGREPAEIVAKRGLKQISNESEIECIFDEIMKKNNVKVKQYRAGRTQLFGHFVGQVMQATGGMAHPAIVNDVVRRKLEE